MLALAISLDQTSEGDMIETDDGTRMMAKDWPQDSESNLVVYYPKGKYCNVVMAYEVAKDIAELLHFIEGKNIPPQRNKWYKRLKQYAEGIRADCTVNSDDV